MIDKEFFSYQLFPICFLRFLGTVFGFDSDFFSLLLLEWLSMEEVKLIFEEMLSEKSESCFSFFFYASITTYPRLLPFLSLSSRLTLRIWHEVFLKCSSTFLLNDSISLEAKEGWILWNLLFILQTCITGVVAIAWREVAESMGRGLASHTTDELTSYFRKNVRP